MATSNLPDDLIALERAAWEEIQAGALTVDTAWAVHAAVTAFAKEAGAPRTEIEMKLKKDVRHGAVEAAG